jgi:hypothetical protein
MTDGLASEQLADLMVEFEYHREGLEQSTEVCSTQYLIVHQDDTPFGFAL